MTIPEAQGIEGSILVTSITELTPLERVQTRVEGLTAFDETLNQIDIQLLIALRERDSISEAIGAFKKYFRLPIFDSAREDAVRVDMFTTLKEKIHNVTVLDTLEQFSDQFWTAIMERSRLIQEGVIEPKSQDYIGDLDLLRARINIVNSSITDLVVARMKLYQIQITQPGYGIQPVYGNLGSIDIESYEPIFTSLHNLCLTTSNQGMIPAGSTAW